MQTKHSSVFTFILFLALSSPVSCGKKDSEVKEKCRICKNIAEDFEKVYAHLSFYNAPDICNRLSVKAVTEPDRTKAPEITEVRRRTVADSNDFRYRDLVPIPVRICTEIDK